MAKWNPRRARENGDFMPRIADIEADIHKERNKNSTRETTISRGALKVNKGANVDVRDGGSVEINDGGNVSVAGGGDIAVADGGDVTLAGGGRLQSHHPNGRVSAALGNFDAGGTVGAGSGVFAYDTNQSLYFYASSTPGVDRAVGLGTFQNPLNQLTSDTNSFRIQARGSGVSVIRTEGDLGLVSMSSGIQISPRPSSSSTQLVYQGNQTAGYIAVSSSSLRFKQDIEDAHISPEDALKMRPRVWRDKAEVEDDGNCDRWHVGFVAEELDEAGLGLFVDYDEDEQPLAVAYDRLSVALLAIVKDQDRRLNNIEERLAALDGQEPKRRRRRWWTKKPKRVCKPLENPAIPSPLGETSPDCPNRLDT